jgi:hypothetical protein
MLVPDISESCGNPVITTENSLIAADHGNALLTFLKIG